MKKICVNFLFLLIFCSPGNVSCNSGAYSDEYNLREQLFVNYSDSIRPVKNQKQGVDVHLTFDLLNIERMDLKSQTMTITVINIMKWKDENLVWTPGSFGGVTSFHVHSGDKKDVWKPDVSSFNTIDDFVELGTEHNPIVIYNDGTVVMESGVVLATHCEVDVTYYPFDTQVCDVLLGTFIYPVDEVNMTIEKIKQDNYRENQEWELRSISATREDMTFDTEPQSVLDVKLTIRRRKPFFLMYLILPLVFLSFLNPVVFLLPSAAGEKMSLSITVLLTYAVFLTVISEHVPSTSKHIPVLAIYLFITFLVSCVCVWLSVVMLKFFHKPEDEKVPRWIKNLTCGFLARVLCIERDCPKCNERIEREKVKMNVVSPNVILVEENGTNKNEQKAAEEHQISWQGVVEIWDNFNFWFFLVFSLVFAIVVLIVLLTN